jgi:hypothetical protein
MRPLLYFCSALVVMALAFWAYRENYATQKALRDLAALQDNIAGLREDIAMQKAEWAYLNRPTRLKELATVNFDRLHLLPLEPEQMADGKSVAFPAPAAPAVPPAGDAPAALSAGASQPAASASDGKLTITASADTSGEITSKPGDKAFP